MEPAFWDSSALVPLCVLQPSTKAAESLSRQYEIAVWWATPVEVCSAFTRLVRMAQLSGSGHVEARVVLAELRSAWREIAPSQPLRAHAERLLDRFPLKAADSLQLAAAMAWSSGRPRARAFVAGGAQLLEAATELGFQSFKV